MKIRLIAINGPWGSGKTWLSNQIIGPDGDPFFRGTPRKAVNSSDCLRKAAIALVGAPDSMPPEVFKSSMFLGLSGRNWMIDLSEKFAKNYDQDFFSRVAYERMLSEAAIRTSHQIIFTNDSVSFDNEMMYFRARSDIDMIGVSIEPPGSAPRGERWQENDSRYNLAHRCEVVAQDSSTAHKKTIEAMQRRGWI